MRTGIPSVTLAHGLFTAWGPLRARQGCFNGLVYPTKFGGKYTSPKTNPCSLTILLKLVAAEVCQQDFM